jgi:hypothetical protein
MRYRNAKIIRRARRVVAGAAMMLTPALLFSPPGHAGIGSSATGSAHLTVNGELVTFTFSVRQLPSGEVVGQAQRVNRSLDAVLHYDLDCLRIVGDNKAVIGGTLTHSSTDAFAPGRHAVFSVIDNGESADDAPDRLSAVALFVALDDPRDCNTFDLPATTVRDIESGNIQVSP